MAEDVTATAPQVDTQNMPVDGQLQAPPAPSPISVQSPQPAAAPPPEPGSSFRHLAPAMIGAILSHAAGAPPTKYGTDSTGKIIALPAAPESTGDKIRRIAGHALAGLAASSNAPQSASGLGKALSGAGAGAQAVTEQQERKDALERAKAKEDFEQEQKTMLQRHQILVGNTTAVRNMIEARKMQLDMDPIRQSGIAMGDAAKQANIPGAETISDAELQARMDASGDQDHFLATHTIFPAGFSEPQMSGDGQLLKEGSGQVVVIPTTGDGKMSLPPAFLDQVKKYASLSGRVSKTELDSLPAGHEIDVKQLPGLYKATEEGRKIWLEGESKPTLSYPTKDGQPDLDHPTLINSVTREPIQALKPGEVSAEAVEEKSKRAVEGAKEKFQEAEAQKNIAQAQEARANAALAASQLAANGTINQAAIPTYMDALKKLQSANPVAFGVLQNIKNPVDQANLLAIANADAEVNKLYPTRTTAKSGQMDARHAFGLAKLINPQLTEQTYQTKQKALTSFADGDDGKSIASFNQFLVHADDARIGSERLQRSNSPWLNQPMNEIRSKGMGAPGVPALMTDIMAARKEWQTFISSGHASDLADTEAARTIMSDASSPAQIMASLREMGKQAVGRLDQIDAKWRRTWGGHYPGLVSDSGRTAAVNLGLGDQVRDYPSESGAMGGVQPQNQPGGPPAGATHKVPGPDGKLHWTNEQGTVDYGVVQ